MSVLIVHPDPLIRTAFVEDFGELFEVHAADSVDACLEILRGAIPDVVLLEPTLRLSGDEALLGLLSNELPTLRRVALAPLPPADQMAAILNEHHLWGWVNIPWEQKNVTSMLHASKVGQEDGTNPTAVHTMPTEVDTLLEEQNRFLRERNEDLRQLASCDGVTGLFNHRYFQDQWRRQASSADRHHYPLSLLVLDIDDFKNFNDRNGHPEGDQLLRSIARLLVNSVRLGDVVARYGGDEFVVILPRATKDSATLLAERIRAMVASQKFEGAEAQPGSMVTVSIGVACYPEDGAEAPSVVVTADQALYQAKQDGRNRVVCAGARAVEAGSSSTETESDDPLADLQSWQDDDSIEDLEVGVDTLVHPATVPNLASLASRAPDEDENSP